MNSPLQSLPKPLTHPDAIAPRWRHAAPERILRRTLDTMDKPHPSNSSGPAATLHLSRLPRRPVTRPSLRVIGLDHDGPRFAPIRALRASRVDVRTSRGAGLPATGLTWTLEQEGVALSLILGN